MTANCKQCGEEFVPRSAKMLFCSKRCGMRDWNARNPGKKAAVPKTGLSVSRGAIASRQRRIKKAHERPDKICGCCGKPFKRHKQGDALYCSAACKNLLTEMVSLYNNVMMQERVMQCKRCSADFNPVSSLVFCSDICRDAQRIERELIGYLKGHERRTKARSCRGCAEYYVPKVEPWHFGMKGRIGNYRFCSDQCQSKHDRRKRGGTKPRHRAKHYGVEYVPFDPFKVFDRDGWRCVNCRAPTPRELRGTNADNAPEIDHIVPMAKGGAHRVDNCWCMCRKCNIRKGVALPKHLEVVLELVKYTSGGNQLRPG